MHEGNRDSIAKIKKPGSPEKGASFEEIEEILLGEIGIDPFKVGYLTLDEISKIMKGYYRRQEKAMQLSWELARWQVMHFVAPYSKKKTLKASDIAVFYWEKERRETPKKQDVLELWDKWQRWEERNKHG